MKDISNLTNEEFLDLVINNRGLDMFKSKTQGCMGNVRHIIKIRKDGKRNKDNNNQPVSVS